ncbi:unnamed protein product [Clavelina lepadiformis]|uniref:FAM69 protein-kinase domain-containing protein n=1 Tax=Clavelina lepadiformis TaxID=159417 RepID=A0ABP0GYN5_CLALP
MSKSSKHDKNGTSIDFSYLFNELMAAVKVQNYFMYLTGCKEADKIQAEEVWHETQHTLFYSTNINNEDVLVEVTKPNMDVLVTAKCGFADSDHSQQNVDRCFLLKNRRILDEAILLMQLRHPNIAKIMGLCVQRKDTSKKHGTVTKAHGVTLAKEGGNFVQLEQLKSASWEERLKVAFDFLSLALYLTDTPLGNIRLEDWSADNFIVSAKDGKSKLNNLQQTIYSTEPFCKSNKDCLVNGLNCGIQCDKGKCVGYNEKKNLHELNQAILSPLLRYNVPQKLTDDVLKILSDLNNLKVSTSQAVMTLMHLLPSSQPGVKLAPQMMAHNAVEENNAGILSMKRFPDGSQVDSWEQHEMVVSINEVNLDLIDNVQHAVEIDPPVEIKPEKTVAFGFRKIENADYPGRYDYYCSHSKAEWGCVLSLPVVDEALQKCADDVKCKAVVTIPHLRKEGWIIAILKSDNSQPVDHAGTTVYVKAESSDSHSFEEMPPAVDVNMGPQKADCLNEVTSLQSKERSAFEAAMMKACGWPGFTGEQFSTMVEESKVEDATTFKPARGKLANGGQMNVMLNSQDTKRAALFLAKRGPDEFDLSQLAVYQLDQMLGLYKTIPAVERLLTAEELSDAGFPVDVGGNQFDKFRPLKQSDSSLLGVIVPQVNARITLEHHLSVPRLSGITNAVTPFSKKQLRDLEYLLLGYLASVPVPRKGHPNIQGRLIHIRTEEAFLHDSNEYMSYLYHCQFPSRVIATLRYAEKNRCDLGSQIRSRLADNNSPDISKVLKTNVRELLKLVDQCIAKFGRQEVLYDMSL